MRTTEKKLTLANARESRKLKEQTFRPSDFLADDEIEKLRESNQKGKKQKRPYDEIDALEAEILARFGWHTFQAYQTGEISLEQLAKYLQAERARSVAERYNLECIIVGAMAGANHAKKGGGTPKGLRTAIDIVKEDYKRAKGEI